MLHDNFIKTAKQESHEFKALLNILSSLNLHTKEGRKLLCVLNNIIDYYINREVDASLSGGELKRIEIATIIARGTELSVFDEPEAGIDLWSFNSLIKVFEKMQLENNNSILIISHQERILNIADDIVLLADGLIKAHGNKEEILPMVLGTNSDGICKKLKA